MFILIFSVLQLLSFNFFCIKFFNRLDKLQKDDSNLLHSDPLQDIQWNGWWNVQTGLFYVQNVHTECQMGWKGTVSREFYPIISLNFTPWLKCYCEVFFHMDLIFAEIFDIRLSLLKLHTYILGLINFVFFENFKLPHVACAQGGCKNHL